jgi:large subunit ribosomal protein L6
MSRVGKEPIPIPKGVEVGIVDGVFTAKGPKGVVSERMLDGINVEIEADSIQVSRTEETGEFRSKHGLIRALFANAVHGVAEGFTKELEINGVGFRAEVQGNQVQMALGFSHPVIYKIPESITIEVDKANNMVIKGANRQLVGQVAAEIRSLKKPEPYKGKGIKYKDEVVRRKVGKAGA